MQLIADPFLNIICLYLACTRLYFQNKKYYVMHPKRNTNIIVRDIFEMVRKSEQNPFVSNALVTFWCVETL